MPKYTITTFGPATCFVGRTYEIEAESEEQAQDLIYQQDPISEEIDFDDDYSEIVEVKELNETSN